MQIHLRLAVLAITFTIRIYCRGFHNSKEAGLKPWPDLRLSNSCLIISWTFKSLPSITNVTHLLWLVMHNAFFSSKRVLAYTKPYNTCSTRFVHTTKIHAPNTSSLVYVALSPLVSKHCSKTAFLYRGELTMLSMFCRTWWTVFTLCVGHFDIFCSSCTLCA